MSNYDLYRDYIQDNFDPGDADAEVPICIQCQAVLLETPTDYVKVRDQVIAWDEKNGCPLEWSWVNEPVYKCANCDYVNSLDEVYR